MRPGKGFLKQLLLAEILIRRGQLICWSTGPINPILSKTNNNNNNNNNNITIFLPTGFFLIYYFLLFGKKKKRKEIKHSKLI